MNSRIIMIALSVCCWVSAPVAADDERQPSVGMTGRIEQLVLPGSELVARPLDNDEIPIVLRITAVFPHGMNMRYDMEFYGLEPGEFDLRDYLVRADGSSTEDLPPIPVTIKSTLPPGQIVPNSLTPGGLPSMGGYRILMIVLATVWFAVLLALIFAGRGKKSQQRPSTRPKTLADYLRPRLEAARAGQLGKQQYAELERMIIAFWRKRLGYEKLDSVVAIQQLRQHGKAGPLLVQLERWMHDPEADRQTDLSELLQPYQDLSLEEIETA